MNARLSLIPGFPLAAGLLALSVSAHADTFGSGADTFTIDFVTVGNPGNGDDRALDVFNHTPGNPGSAALLAAAAFPLLLRRPDQLGANTDGLNHSFTTR